MSIHDPLIRFDATLDILHRHFADVTTLKLHYPSHQPPTPFTYEELTRDVRETANGFLQPQAAETLTLYNNSWAAAPAYAM